MQSEPVLLTIIIPLLNESSALESLIANCRRVKSYFLDKIEFLLIDGGSQDDTLAKLQKLCPPELRFLASGPGSIGMAILKGSAEARGSFLLILPADVEISQNQIQIVLEAAHRDLSWGFFLKQYKHVSWFLSLYSGLQNRVRSQWGRNFVWTNVPVFHRRYVPLVPTTGFLEDVVLSDRLKKQSAGTVWSERVSVDVRKYTKDGVLMRSWQNFIILILFRLKWADVDQLSLLYRGQIRLSEVLKSSWRGNAKK